jgi:hypothetical protein
LTRWFAGRTDAAIPLASVFLFLLPAGNYFPSMRNFSTCKLDCNAACLFFARAKRTPPHIDEQATK